MIMLIGKRTGLTSKVPLRITGGLLKAGRFRPEEFPPILPWELFLLFSALTGLVMFTLPYPNSFYVFITMLSSCIIEYFYQVKRKNQNFPVAQLVGRMDFTLFPVAALSLLTGSLINLCYSTCFFSIRGPLHILQSTISLIPKTTKQEE